MRLLNSKILLFALIAGAFFSSCNKTTSCPEGNLCIEGNTYEYQLNPNGAKLIIEVPEAAMGRNVAITTTDMVPSYPANSDFSDFDRHFGGGYFKIEPTDVVTKQLIKMIIEYPNNGIFDQDGNNYEEALRLWYINDDDIWSMVPSSEVDTENNQVFAWVTNLGSYGVAAEKECIVGVWHFGDSIGEYPYQQRLQFNVNHSGTRDYVMICAGMDDPFISTETFDWQFNDGKLEMFDFSKRSMCDTLDIKTPDMEFLYDCSASSLLIDGLGTFTFTRYVD